MLYSFSLILESVCVLPQLILLRQTTVPTVIDSYYLLTLGSYRAFYILNWIVRAAGSEQHLDPISIIFGVIQTAFYADFAWVYWTRQRIKLRRGGIVDSDDFRKGWLVNKVISRGQQSTETDEEEGLSAPQDQQAAGGGAAPHKVSRWGSRGISVSADDTLDEHQRKGHASQAKGGLGGSSEEASAILQDDAELFSDVDEDAVPNAPAHDTVLDSHQEWGKNRTG